LYAAESLGLNYEFIAVQDTLLLRHVMVGNAEDANGYLLYPDGAPRFRVIYTNGGDAGRHGLALTDTGRQRIRDFFRHGGSYTGSCAGAYLASLSNADRGVEPSFYHLWPGRTKNTNIYNAYVGNFIPESSALLRYHHFGGDFYIDSLYLNSGPFANESLDWPSGTEVLLRYDTTGSRAHNKASAWAWKAHDSTGRIAVVGTHPEGWSFGERLRLMKAVLQYALDGVGAARVKGMLVNGVPREMNRPTGADPAFVKIGDRQYHHFTFDLPPGARGLDVTLDADDSFHLNLYLRRDSFAFRSRAEFTDTAAGADKRITVAVPQPGRWFVGVECATTVETYGDSIFLYRGRTDVLNGVGYTITASWSSGITEAVSATFPALKATVVRGLFVVPDEVGVTVLDAAGRRVAKGGLAPGVYFLKQGEAAPQRLVVTR
ncbi:MAG: pre-peptidase C-terminal domain-containing protein, partial [candidate division WOR-3 bacterium]